MSLEGCSGRPVVIIFGPNSQCVIITRREEDLSRVEERRRGSSQYYKLGRDRQDEGELNESKIYIYIY